MTDSTAITLKEAAEQLAAAQAGGVTQRCVSLTTGTLSPDLRVNYAFGMVLGVDDFTQEQRYFLEKEHLHNRALHGFGTVFGLNVDLSTPSDRADDLLITVRPGMGIDQLGRAFVVRSDQCARLAAWLAAEERRDPGVIARRRQGLSGDMSVYVVARYAECTDALVPIPGQPCSSAEQTQAPSRIRDSFAIELRWEPPAMPVWEAVRDLADLMARVRVVRGLPAAHSDEEAILALVRAIGAPALSPGGIGNRGAIGSAALDRIEAIGNRGAIRARAAERLLRLPADGAREAIDRILTAWSTEVRPSLRLPPDLLDPATGADGTPAEAAVLLARIDFLPTEPFNAQRIGVSYPQRTEGGTTTPTPADDEGRPYLLHTQLIQELLPLAGAGLETRAFAALAARGPRTLRVWVHHGEPLDTPGVASVRVATDVGSLRVERVLRVERNLFDLELDAGEPESPGDAEPTPLPPGSLVQLTFQLDALTIGGRPLLDSLDTYPHAYLGRAGTALTAYTVVTAGDQPVRPFVTITTQSGGEIEPRLALWFHTDAPLRLPARMALRRGFAPDSPPINFEAQPAEGRSSPGRAPFAYAWLLRPSGTTLRNGDVLGLRFDTDTIEIGEPGVALTSRLGDQTGRFLGHDGGTGIGAYHVVSLPPQAGLSREEVERLIREAIAGIPQPEPRRPEMPFATVAASTDASDMVRMELWLHPDFTTDSYLAAVSPDEFIELRPYRIFAEGQKDGELFDLTDLFTINPVRRNVFRLRANFPQFRERSQGSFFLRWIFQPEQILVEREGERVELRRLMEGSRYRYVGFDGKAITVYVRVVAPQGGDQ